MSAGSAIMKRDSILGVIQKSIIHDLSGTKAKFMIFGDVHRKTFLIRNKILINNSLYGFAKNKKKLDKAFRGRYCENKYGKRLVYRQSEYFSCGFVSAREEFF